MMKSLIWVFIGGGAGSMLRFALSKWFNGTSFPYGTLLANVLASFLLGYLISKNVQSNETLRWLVAVGFCGGFSTFSTFSLESFKYLQAGSYAMAIGHIVANFSLCLAAIVIAYMLNK